MVKFLNEACVPLRSPCVQYEKVVPTLTNTSSRYRLMSHERANYTWAWRMRDAGWRIEIFQAAPAPAPAELQ